MREGSGPDTGPYRRSARRRDPPKTVRVTLAVVSGMVRLACRRRRTGESAQTPSRTGHDDGHRDRGGAQEEAAPVGALHVIEGDRELGRRIRRGVLGVGGVHTSECEPRSQRNINFAGQEPRRADTAGNRAAFRRSSSGLAPPRTP